MIDFTFSGSIRPINERTGNNAPGRSFLINSDTDEILAIGTNPLNDSSISLTPSGLNNRADVNAYLVSAGKGFSGQSVQYNDLAPLENVVFETFDRWPREDLDDSTVTSGTVVFSGITFEDGVLPAELSTTFYASSVSTSGVISGSEMDGDYFFGLNGSSAGVLIYPTTLPSGVTFKAGRTIFLAKLADTTLSNQEGEVGFGFFRDGTSSTDNGTKLSFENRPGEHKVLIRQGQMLNSDNDLRSGTAVFNEKIDYTNDTVKASRILKWFRVEWEGAENTASGGNYIGIAFKDYEEGDTIESVKSQFTPMVEYVLDGYGMPSQVPVINNDNGVGWLLTSRNSGVTGFVGIDNLYLEDLSNVPRRGLSRFKLTSRPSNAANALIGIGNVNTSTDAPPESTPGPIRDPEGYTTPSGRSFWGVAGEGPIGVETFKSTGASDRQVKGLFEINEEGLPTTVSGMTEGVCRVLVRVPPQGTRPCRWGFAFLRQGDDYNDDAYLIELRGVTSNTRSINLRKGTITQTMSTNISTTGSQDFGGTILTSSSSITVPNEPADYIWLEIRWQVVGSEVEIQVLYKTVDDSLSTFDESPGNVDEELTEAFSYTDSSSPYTSTSYGPAFMHINDPKLKRFELRRVK